MTTRRSSATGARRAPTGTGNTHHRSSAPGVVAGSRYSLAALLLALTSGAGCALVPTSDALTSPAVATSADTEMSTMDTARATPPAGPAAAPADIGIPAGWLSRNEVPFEPPAPVEEELPDVDLTGDSLVVDETLLFSVGSAVLAAGADNVLEPLAAQAAEHLAPDQELWIGGYVDEQGGAAFNEVLAQDRADAVTARIIRLQPALEGRIVAVGHGEDELLHPGCRGDCQANRAVVFHIEG